MEQLLRDKIEDRVGRRMNVPRDFAWLSEEIEQRTRQRVSASTLRRFWGYVNEGVTASRYTKDVLAHYLGYSDFEEFKSLQGGGNEQSQPLLSEQICSDDLYEGQIEAYVAARPHMHRKTRWRRPLHSCEVGEHETRRGRHSGVPSLYQP